MSCLVKCIGLIFILLPVGALKILYLLEAEKTVLLCQTYESRWLVTSNGHSRIVSACQAKYFNCTDNEPDSFVASFASNLGYWRYGCYNSSFCQSLWIRNATVGITRISCDTNEWELRVKSGPPYVHVLANNRSHYIDVLSCTKVTFTCVADMEPGTKLTLYMDSLTNVLAEAYHPETITYSMFFYQYEIHTVYCSVNILSSNIKVYVSAPSPVNLTADKLVIYSGDNITFSCQACGANGTLLTLEAVKGNRVLAQTELPGVISYTMERVQSVPMFFDVKCRTRFNESQVLITVKTCYVRHVTFTANGNLVSIEVTPNGTVQLACEAEASMGEAIVISEQATGLVLRESYVPTLILHTMTNFSCGTTQLLQCQVCYNAATRQTVEIRVSPCDLTAGYKTTTEITAINTPYVEIIVGASLSSWAFLIIVVFVLFAWIKRRRLNALIPAASHQQSDTGWVTTEISDGVSMEPPSYSELMLKPCIRLPDYIFLPPTYDEAVYSHE